MYSVKTFSKGMLSDFLRAAEEALVVEVNSLNERRMLESDLDELAEYLNGKYSFEPLELDRTDPAFGYSESTQRASDYGRPITKSGFLCWLDVPFTGDEKLIQYQPNQFSVHTTELAIFDRSHFRISQFVYQLDDANLKRNFDNELDSIAENLGYGKLQIQQYNSGLIRMAKERLTARRTHFEKATAALATLPYRVTRRSDAATTISSPVKRKRITPQLPPLSSEQGPPEPSISLSVYRDILSAISNFSLTVERSPSAFLNQGEEAIRFQILAMLNATFEADATGETFNYSGKTDILLRAEGKTLFIAECKFWRGEGSYLETIDQLLGYLSWRDTKAAVIIFSKNKDFTNVLNVIKSATPTHSNFVSEIAAEEETRFDYLFTQLNDKQRRLHLSTLVFNIPAPNRKE